MTTDHADKVGSRIRATHPAGFRCGEWATVAAVGIYFPDDADPAPRDCYVVRFDDGRLDLWPVVDPSDPYEFEASTALTRWGRYVAAMAEIGLEAAREEDGVGDWRFLRFLLIERNVGGELPPYWTDFYDTLEAAAAAHVSQEYPEDWPVYALIDLDTGMRYEAEDHRTITWTLADG